MIRPFLLLVLVASVWSIDNVGSQFHIEENLEEYVPNELLDMVASEQAPGTDNVEAALVTVLKQKSLIAADASFATRASMRKEVARIIKNAGGPARLFKKIGLRTFFKAMGRNKWMKRLMKIWTQVRAFRKDLRTEMRRREAVENAQYKSLQRALKAVAAAKKAKNTSSPAVTSTRSATANVLKKIDGRISRMKRMKHKSLDLARRWARLIVDAARGYSRHIVAESAKHIASGKANQAPQFSELYLPAVREVPRESWRLLKAKRLLRKAEKKARRIREQLKNLGGDNEDTKRTRMSHLLNLYKSLAKRRSSKPAATISSVSSKQGKNNSVKRSRSAKSSRSAKRSRKPNSVRAVRSNKSNAGAVALRCGCSRGDYVHLPDNLHPQGFSNNVEYRCNVKPCLNCDYLSAEAKAARKLVVKCGFQKKKCSCGAAKKAKKPKSFTVTKTAVIGSPAVFVGAPFPDDISVDIEKQTAKVLFAGEPERKRLAELAGPPIQKLDRSVELEAKESMKLVDKILRSSKFK